MRQILLYMIQTEQAIIKLSVRNSQKNAGDGDTSTIQQGSCVRKKLYHLQRTPHYLCLEPSLQRNKLILTHSDTDRKNFSSEKVFKEASTNAPLLLFLFLLWFTKVTWDASHEVERTDSDCLPE
jgi:hypothetical protein